MCGITGYINIDLKPIRNTSTILSMLKVQKHRGPDDSGIRLFNMGTKDSVEVLSKVPMNLEGTFDGVLGFNRLSILDLSQNGHQPMVSPDNKVFLTLNGEIYNAFDYIPELEGWGYSFKSTSDTEVVLALYLKYGINGLLERLNGMFAIVVVDLIGRELFIARDRFGIKPIYYIKNDEVLAFSSELKSFAFLNGFEMELNEEKLDEYLMFRNNLRGTLFRNIESLEPGHYISYRHRRGIEKSGYFDINSYTRIKKSGSLIDIGSELEEWISKSVRRQLMSDVMLGSQLSGGIDSTLVTWLANRNSTKGNFESVSIVFKDPRFSEEKYMDLVTNKLGIKSHKFFLESDYFLDNLEKATWHLEAPINHPNSVAIYKLSQRAKEHVTVLLSGEGADEVFGGYTRFYELSYPYKLRYILNNIRNNLGKPYDFLGYFHHEYRAVNSTSFMSRTIASQLKKDFSSIDAIEQRENLYRSLSGSLFDRQVKYELLSFLPDLLIRQDKMSMAHSIENRVPFLDNEVVENSFLIPEKFLIQRYSSEGENTEKYLLKILAAREFGNDFAFRKKVGFGVPLREFFLNDKFLQYIHDKLIPGIKGRGILDSRIVSGWIKNIRNLNYRQLEALWVVVSFEIWASVFIDGEYQFDDTRFK